MIGTLIGKYRVLAILGEGGMGRVLLVEHVLMGTRHALKLLHDSISKNEQIVQRFINEARAAGALHSRNIIEIHDVDQLGPGGPHYLVMKYMEGQTLAQYLESHPGPLEPWKICHICVEALNGMHLAHAQGIIHRDLKPDNLYLTRDDETDDPLRTIILDFGVAHVGDDSGLTKTGAVIGTPQYMAPEQLGGKLIDFHVDIWAIGAIAYELATRMLLYHDDGAPRGSLSGPEIFYRMMTRPIVDPRYFNPAITEPFAMALLRALDPDPTKRPNDRELAVLFAQGTPNGMEILRKRAPKLIERDNLGETIRKPGPAPAPAAVSPRYEVGEKLGEGGMAEVFRATVRGAEGFTRTVALKRVRDEVSQVPEFAAMFIEEARIASRLVHDNIVAVIDFNRDAANRLFLAMEFVDGKDLAKLVETGPVPPSTAIYVIEKMLRGLGYAHEVPIPERGTVGVIHRDVSPHNVMLTWQGGVRVNDFGIAKARDAGGSARSVLLKGKPAYMSPEQAAGEAIDPRSDLFAVGIVAWEMLTGKALFDRQTAVAFDQIFNRDAPPVSSAGVRIASDLDRVVRKLLARDRNDRYPSAAAAIEALTACKDHPRDGQGELMRLMATRFPRDAVSTPSPLTSPPVGGETRPLRMTPPNAVTPVSTLGAAASQSLAPVDAARPRRRTWIGIAVAMTLALTAGAILVVLRHQTAASQPSIPIDAAVATTPVDAVVAVVAADAPRADSSVTTTAVVDAGAIDAQQTAARSIDAGVPSKPDAGVKVHHVVAVPTGTGTLHAVILPWAEVWVDGKAYGQTPVDVPLSAGTHRVRMKSDIKEKTVTITVTASKQTVIDENWNQ